jgi:hypothetical protein
MQDLDHQKPSRSLRAGVAARPFASAQIRESSGAKHSRRGRTAHAAVWRRIEMGTNHIACFGVWRRGTRRQAMRQARPGTTRWHMPHRGGAAVVLLGAVRDVANEN